MTELELQIQAYFGIMDPADLGTIASLFQLATIKKGEYLLQEGMQCDKLCFVQAGLLRMYMCRQDKEITQWISKKGFFTADISSFLFETSARLSIQALENCQIAYISINDYKIIGDLVPKWHQIEKLFVLRCFIILEDRIVSHLSMTAKERYEHFFENNKELFNQIPLQYLASMLGMTPETLSRIRKNQVP
jgi:CRP/FNR family transcriptional regulator, anaerobic regulatory protein